MYKTLLWLDDWRNPIDNPEWIKMFCPQAFFENWSILWAKNYNEFVDILDSEGLPDYICFDHDLADESENENSDWIEEEDFGKFSDKIRPILRKLSSIKIIVKDTIFHFGKWLFLKIKQLLLLIKEKFPNLVMGLVLGFILGLILSSIPVVGWILQGFIVPLLTIVGGVLGLKRDIENNENMGSELLQLITNKIKELFTYLQNGIKSKFSFAK